MQLVDLKILNYMTNIVDFSLTYWKYSKLNMRSYYKMVEVSSLNCRYVSPGTV